MRVARQGRDRRPVLVMPAALREAQREYLDDLQERVRRVPCPVCGAKPKQLCRAVRYGTTRLRDVRWTHADRNLVAKQQGHVKGLRAFQRHDWPR